MDALSFVSKTKKCIYWLTAFSHDSGRPRRRLNDGIQDGPIISILSISVYCQLLRISGIISVTISCPSANKMPSAGKTSITKLTLASRIRIL